MKIVIYGATEVGCLLATEFFEDHDITVIDKEENRTEEFDKLDISFVQAINTSEFIISADFKTLISVAFPCTKLITS